MKPKPESMGGGDPFTISLNPDTPTIMVHRGTSCVVSKMYYGDVVVSASRNRVTVIICNAVNLVIIGVLNTEVIVL